MLTTYSRDFHRSGRPAGRVKSRFL